MKIACVQQNHNHGEVSENRAKALASAEKALDMGAELVLFHEEMLVGYDARFRELAEPADGETTEAFASLLRAKNSDSLIIYGLTERDGDKLYISAPVVSRGGLAAIYRKTHLWWNGAGLRDETAAYTPGDRLVSFEYKGERIGLLICYDGDFPEMFRAYARDGCSAVLWMNNRSSRAPDDQVAENAVRNSLVVAACCCCGTDELGNVCPGSSCIVGCGGEVLARLDMEEGIVFADADLSSAKALRAGNPWFTGSRPELYAAPAEHAK